MLIKKSCSHCGLLTTFLFPFPVSHQCTASSVSVSGGCEKRGGGHLVMHGTRITIITVNINRDPITREFKHGFSIFIDAINKECAAKCLL